MDTTPTELEECEKQESCKKLEGENRKERMEMLRQRQKERIALAKTSIPLGIPIFRQNRSLELLQEHTSQLQIGSNDSMKIGVSERNNLVIEISKRMVDVWCEEELDSLWVGVRRYGQNGNWEEMLNDPNLYFSKYKTADALSQRWNVERQNYINKYIHLNEETTDLPRKLKGVIRDSSNEYEDALID